MSADATVPPYDGVKALTRSLFGFALLAWLPLPISWIMFLLSQASPDATYEQVRRAFIIGSGLVSALALVWTIRIYRLDANDSAHMANWIAKLSSNRWLVLASILILFEANILAALMLRDIAPAITSSARFLFFCWTLLFAGLQLTLHWRTVNALYLLYGNALALTGLFIVSLAVFFALYVVSSQLLALSGLQSQLRGVLDYRKLVFVDGGSTPSARQFWAEQGRTRVRWLPYSYWTVEPIAGDFINVSPMGLRRSAAETDDGAARRIYFFGGSTMWGEGARDAYTIPSQAGKKLADQGLATVVRNFAQTGYVSAQDLILFQSQLALGNVPDLAVFYHGFNDVYSAWLQDMVGIPLRESQRVSDVEAGRLLRGGMPVLRLPDANLSQYDWSLVATTGASAAAIVDRWLANRRLIRAVAQEYGVTVLFVWQPALYAKMNPTSTEAGIMSRVDEQMPGFVELYRQVDKLIQEHASGDGRGDLVFLTDLFRDYTGDIFFDRVHVNELGNEIVAQSLLEPIMILLQSN